MGYSTVRTLHGKRPCFSVSTRFNSWGRKYLARLCSCFLSLSNAMGDRPAAIQTTQRPGLMTDITLPVKLHVDDVYANHFVFAGKSKSAPNTDEI